MASNNFKFDAEPIFNDKCLISLASKIVPH